MPEECSNLKQAVKEHWMALFIAMLPVIAGTWAIFHEIRLDPMKQELEQTKRSLDNEKYKKEELQKSVTLSKEEIEVLSKEFSKTKQDLEKSKIDLKKIAKELDKKSKDLKQTVDTLKIKTTKIDKINIQLKHTISKLEVTNDSLLKKRNEIQSLSDELSKVKTSLKSTIDEIRKTKLDMDSISKESSKFKEAYKDISKILNKVNETLEKTQTKLEIISIPKDILNIQKSILDSSESSNSDLKVSGSIYDSGDTIIADFYLEQSTYFPKGKYVLRDAYEQAGMIKAINKFITEIKSMDFKHVKLELRGVFEGGSDTFLYNKNIGIYNGEYGPVIKNDVLVNGEIKDFQVYKGDKVTNSDLAFLRAYGVYKAFEGLASSNALVLTDKGVEFIANEYKKSGREYRFGKISVKIYKIKKDTEEISMLK